MDAFTITDMPIAKRFAIAHPIADRISILDEKADATCKELAFFKNSEWVTKYLDEFAGYADGIQHNDTLVYRYVPNYLVNAFLEQWGNE